MSEVTFCPPQNDYDSMGSKLNGLRRVRLPPPETNTAQELPGLRHLPQKERIIFQASIFRCDLCEF